MIFFFHNWWTFFKFDELFLESMNFLQICFFFKINEVFSPNSWTSFLKFLTFLSKSLNSFEFTNFFVFANYFVPFPETRKLLLKFEKNSRSMIYFLFQKSKGKLVYHWDACESRLKKKDMCERADGRATERALISRFSGPACYISPFECGDG